MKILTLIGEIDLNTIIKYNVWSFQVCQLVKIEFQFIVNKHDFGPKIGIKHAEISLFKNKFYIGKFKIIFILNILYSNCNAYSRRKIRS